MGTRLKFLTCPSGCYKTALFVTFPKAYQLRHQDRFRCTETHSALNGSSPDHSAALARTLRQNHPRSMNAINTSVFCNKVG